MALSEGEYIGSNNNKLKGLFCKFFSKGICNRVPCPFSHNINTSLPIPEGVCLFFLQNQCIYGSSCRFLHKSADEVCQTQLDIQNNGPLELPSSAAPYSNDVNCIVVYDEPSTSLYNNGCNNFPKNNSNENSYSNAKFKSYAEACKSDIHNLDEEKSRLEFCPLAIEQGSCPDDSCVYLHGEQCDLCNRLILHPYNEQQRKDHRDECIKEHERRMEQAFAIKRSIGKACGICMDLVIEKEPPLERRFGILEKCDHIFCLSCIRKWRKTDQLDKNTIRSCPFCRIFSAFVIPSKYWYDNSEDKDKLIAEYKDALSKIPCKHYSQGNRECPFDKSCFYLHASDENEQDRRPPPRRGYRSGENEFQRNLGDIFSSNRSDPMLLTIEPDFLEYFMEDAIIDEEPYL